MPTADRRLVTAARFRTAGEAHVARTFLEAQGIPGLVLEQDGLRFDPFRPAPAAGVRLQVRAADLEASRALLGRALLGEAATETGG